MPDVRIIQDTRFPAYAVTLDWLLMPNGALDETQALQTAVIVALGTDRLALPADILPDPDNNDRRGCWMDMDAEEIWGGWPLGTRLWEMKRDVIAGPNAAGGSTIAKAENFARECIQPLVDKRIASRMNVFAERNAVNRIDVSVTLSRGPEVAVDLRYADLWGGITA